MALVSLTAANFPVKALKWYPAGAISGGGGIVGSGQWGDVAGAGLMVAELTGLDLADYTAIAAWRGLLLDPLDGIEQVIVEMHDWPLTASAITAEISDAAAVNAPEIEVEINPAAGYTPLAGHPFTIVYATLGPHIHYVRRVLDHTGDVWTLEIRPNLHDDVLAEVAVDFTYRRCVMKAIDPNREAWPTIGEGWSSTVSIRFEESFDPAEEA